MRPTRTRTLASALGLAAMAATAIALAALLLASRRRWRALQRHEHHWHHLVPSHQPQCASCRVMTTASRPSSARRRPATDGRATGR